MRDFLNITELETNAESLKQLEKEYTQSLAVLKREGVSDKGKGSKGTVKDIVDLLAQDLITREAAISEISKLSGKTVAEVSAVLKINGL